MSEISIPTPAQPQEIHAEVAILGAGPGGYTAAFRAADLGKSVVLIERYRASAGSVSTSAASPPRPCCTPRPSSRRPRPWAPWASPSRQPQIDLDQMRAGKDKVVARLTGGLAALAKQRKVQVVTGDGALRGPQPHRAWRPARARSASASTTAIIACGSTPVRIPGFPHEDPRVMDSTGALELAAIPGRMLIVGGGIIGLEMATVYQRPGLAHRRGGVAGPTHPRLRPGPGASVCEKVIKPALRADHAGDQGRRHERRTRRASRSVFEGKGPGEETYDKVLVAVGRRPNGKLDQRRQRPG